MDGALLRQGDAYALRFERRLSHPIDVVWRAITETDELEHWFPSQVQADLRVGGRMTFTFESMPLPDGPMTMRGEVTEFDPPRRLVHGWRSLYSPELAAEKTSRVTWEIEPQDGGYCLLRVVHDQLEGAPMTAESVSGQGWMMVLSGLKTLLETGKPLAG